MDIKIIHINIKEKPDFQGLKREPYSRTELNPTAL
jgi:hypothetical protein